MASTKTDDRFMQADILVSGAGLAGITLAILLDKAGFNVVLIDPAAPNATLKGIEPGNHTSALMEGSLDVLKDTGAWELCAPYSAPLEVLRIIDDSVAGAPPVDSSFYASEIGLPQFGMNISNNILRAALCETLAKHKNIKYLQTKITAIDNAPTQPFALVTLENGKQVKAKLIAAADGRRSPVRNMAGIGIQEKDYGQKAVTFLMTHSLPHNETSTEYHRPSGPFTMVPMPDKNGQYRSSVVWVDTAENADEFIKASKQAFTQMAQDRTNGLLGDIELDTPPQAFPLISLKADRVTAPRIALIAEAAHVVHPLGAQGLNLSLRDIAALLDVVTGSARVGLDIGSETILSQYEQSRRRDIESRVKGTQGLTKMLCTDSQILKTVRRTGLKAVSAIPPLKIATMKEGLSPPVRQSKTGSDS